MGGKVSYRIASVVFGAMAFSLLFVSEGRGSLLSLSFGYVMFFFLVKNRQILADYTSKLLIMVSLGFFIYLVFNGTLMQHGVDIVSRDMTVNNRTDLWSVAVSEILVRPWFGWGAYSYAFSGFSSWMPAHPHQAFLLIAFEWGVPIAIGFFVVAIIIVIILVRRVYEIGDVSLSLVLASFISLCIHAQVSSVLTMPVGQMSFGLLLGQLLFATEFSEKIRLKSSCFSLFGFAVGVWFLVCCSYMAYFGSSDDKWNKAHLMKDQLQPRTWNNAS